MTRYVTAAALHAFKKCNTNTKQQWHMQISIYLIFFVYIQRKTKVSIEIYNRPAGVATI